MHILWTIIIGFVAGVIAKLIHSGPNEPTGFILTTLLGIAGAFVATYLRQAIGWYRVGEETGFIGSVAGAVIVLLVWGFLPPGARRVAQPNLHHHRTLTLPRPRGTPANVKPG